MIQKAGEMAARGLTQEQIASCLGMGESTIYAKFKEYPEFEDAIKRGRDKGINIVANALFENATSGDKIAQMFYLKCRAGWKETNINEVKFEGQEAWIDKLK
jgi:predicted transcriptional regulator